MAVKPNVDWYQAESDAPVYNKEKDKNEGAPFSIVSHRTGETVGKAGTLQGARRSRDKRDNEYGGYNHHILDSTGKRRMKSGGKIDLDDCKITSGEHKNPKHKGF